MTVQTLISTGTRCVLRSSYGSDALSILRLLTEDSSSFYATHGFPCEELTSSFDAQITPFTDLAHIHDGLPEVW